MPTLATTHLRRALYAATATVVVVPAAAGAPPAAHAEGPTPQAIDAHAEFLAYPATPKPAAPVKVCVVDTGVDLTTDAAGAVIERYSQFGGDPFDTPARGNPKHRT